jgi:hypothetical protein
MLTSCDATLNKLGGKWFITVGAYSAPSITFDESHLRSGYSVRTATPFDQLANTVSGIYANRAAKWQSDAFPVVSDASYISDDGRTLPLDISLPFTDSPAMAQRLARIAMRKTRKGIVITFPGNLSCYRAKLGDIVGLSIDELGWSNKPFEVIQLRKVLGQDGEAPVPGVDLLLKETASSIYDWTASSDEAEVDDPPQTNLPDRNTVLAPTALSIDSGTAALTETNNGILAGAIMSWTLPDSPFVGVQEIEFKLSTSSSWSKTATIPGDATKYSLGPFMENVSYDFRVRQRSVLGKASAWNTVSGHSIVGKSANPDPPSIASVTDNKDKSLSVIWTNANDLDIDRSVINYDTDPGFGSPEVLEVGKGVDHITIPNLNVGSNYYVRIKHVDTTGHSSGWDTFAGVAVTFSIQENFQVKAGGNLESANFDDTGGSEEGYKLSDTQLLMYGGEIKMVSSASNYNYVFKPELVTIGLYDWNDANIDIIARDNGGVSHEADLRSYVQSPDGSKSAGWQMETIVSNTRGYSRLILDSADGTATAPKLHIQVGSSPSTGGVTETSQAIFSGIPIYHRDSLFTGHELRLSHDSNGGLLEICKGGSFEAYEVLGKFYATANGGKIALNDENGDLQAYFGVFDSIGNSELVLRDSNGNEEVYLQTGARNVVYIAGSEFTHYNSTNTDVTGLIAGSTFGTLIQGQASAHVVVGIAGNDVTDGFYVIKDATNSLGLGSYDTFLMGANSTRGLWTEGLDVSVYDPTGTNNDVRMTEDTVGGLLYCSTGGVDKTALWYSGLITVGSVEIKSAVSGGTQYAELTNDGGGGIARVRDENGTVGVEMTYDHIDFKNLPTSDPSVAGRLWNDSGIVKISAG